MGQGVEATGIIIYTADARIDGEAEQGAAPDACERGEICAYNRLSRVANGVQGHGHEAQVSLTVRLPIIQGLAFSIFGSENLARLKYLRISETNRLVKQASIKNFDLNFGVALLLSGLGVVYVSRFLLRKYPKKKGNDLKNLDSQLEGIHQTYLVLNTVTVLGFAFMMFLIYQSNQAFWKERVFVLFVLVSVVFTLFDAMLATYSSAKFCEVKRYYHAFLVS